MTDEEMLCVFGDAHMLDGLRAVARLLRQGQEDDRRDGPRWERLSDGEICDHAHDHLQSVAFDVATIDGDSGEPEACHVAARGLQLATRAVQ